ncbi:MAG: ABC transporter ATP-binding protein [Bacillota bacterium]|nr:ABC transporter ATP-binding protein [Bacillota bacterium]NLM08373.1 ABC transporter ATP-binding protein [Clostridiales Family XIII bacterium]
MDNKNRKLLEVKDLRVSFFTPVGEVKAVGGISYDLNYGEVMGIVGESGSGKSVEAYAIMGLLQSPGKVVGGSITFDGEDVLAKSEKEMQAFRGNQVSMIFQNPMTCLNPVYTIGDQLIEAIRCHKKISKAEAREKSIEMLKLVGINNPERRMNQYPHEFSGGMRQRVMIAMGLICDPKMLIADEPTTALDVTIQAQIIELMKDIQQKTQMTIIFITHNLGVVAEICDRVTVMYAGKIVEQGNVEDIFYRPHHPYTMGLLRSMPRLDEEEYERLIPIEGTPVDMLNPPAGCPFGPRCEHCMKICLRREPPQIDLGDGHTAACWLLADEAKRLAKKEETPNE